MRFNMSLDITHPHYTYNTMNEPILKFVAIPLIFIILLFIGWIILDSSKTKTEETRIITSEVSNQLPHDSREKQQELEQQRLQNQEQHAGELYQRQQAQAEQRQQEQIVEANSVIPSNIIISDPNRGVEKDTLQNIWEAIENGTIQDVRFFIEKGVDVNAKNVDDLSLLHFAARCNPNADVVSYLIEKGADINVKDSNSLTPLHYASMYNPNVEVMKHLIEKGADVNAKNVDDLLLLHFIARDNPNASLVKYLIEKGVDVNVKDSIDLTPLHYASMYNPNIEVMKHLIEKGADVDNMDIPHGFPPVYWVGTKEKTVILLEHLEKLRANEEERRIKEGIQTMVNFIAAYDAIKPPHSSEDMVTALFDAVLGARNSGRVESESENSSGGHSKSITYTFAGMRVSLIFQDGKLWHKSKSGF